MCVDVLNDDTRAEMNVRLGKLLDDIRKDDPVRWKKARALIEKESAKQSDGDNGGKRRYRSDQET